jgi:serine/threonine-protein kinase
MIRRGENGRGKNGGGNGENRRLLRVAASIADGIGVDWEHEALSTSDRDELAMLVQMEKLSAIAGAHRARQQAHEEEAPGGAVASDSPSRWGHIDALELIDSGTYGEVFRGHDTHLDCDVALKLLNAKSCASPERAEEAIREGTLLARVDHRNVASVLGAEVHDGRVGIWMRFIRGRTLQEILEERGVLGADEAAIIGRDLCRALAAIHQAGLIHRDIKPKNVMRQEGGAIVLVDMGTCGELDSLGSSQEASFAGTPLYMAPETLLHGRTSIRSDIYSLGVLLFHLVTGDYPVYGKTVDDLTEAHRSGRSRLLRDVRADLPESFVRVVEVALESRPERRYESAGRLERALDEALAVRTTAGTHGVVSVDDTAKTASHASTVDGGRRDARSLWRRVGARLRRPLPMVAAVVVVATVLAVMAQYWLIDPPYSVEAALYRQGAASGAPRTRLDWGDRLAVGDQLSMEIASSRDVFVYVMSEDDRGDAYLLFPTVHSTLTNPLDGERTYVLPGTRVTDGRPFSWLVTSAGVREHIVIIASPRKLPEVEAMLGALPEPRMDAETGPDPYPTLSDELILRLRGVGGFAAGDARTDHGAGARRIGLSDVVARLEPEKETVRGVWHRQIELVYDD